MGFSKKKKIERTLERSLRMLSRVIGQVAKRSSQQAARFSTGKVADDIVNVTVVDDDGQRHLVAGRAGQTLLQAAHMNGLEWLIQDDSHGGGATYQVKRSERFTEQLFGEGCSSPVSRIVVPEQWVDKLDPPSFNELDILEYLPEEDRVPGSRLATEIVLSKNLEGLMVVAPPPTPYDPQNYDDMPDQIF